MKFFANNTTVPSYRACQTFSDFQFSENHDVQENNF